MIRHLLRKPLTWVLLALLGVAGSAGLYWFQPWRLVTDTEVRETLTVAGPAAAAPSAAGPGSSGPGSSGPGSSGPGSSGPGSSGPGPRDAGAGAAGPAILRQGAFVTHEHTTTGTARLVRAADGGHRLEIAGLDTSDGPDLRVWLTDQPVHTGRAGWHVFDDGRRVELGRLKGNRGDQVYELPGNVDPADFRSVSIWCKRFAVSFGAAPLTAAP